MPRLSALIVFLFLISLPTSLFADTHPHFIKGVKSQEKIIALTFDDGPNKKITPQLLAILDHYQIKATFFLLAENVKNYPKLTKKIQAAGHDIGNHSWGHIDFGKISPLAARNNIQKSQSIFYRTLGTFPKYFRPPYGNLSRSQIGILSRYFHKSIKWNIDSQDWHRDISTQDIIDNVLKDLRSGGIILCHDTHPAIVEALPKLIETLQKKGYRFVDLSTLLKSGPKVLGYLRPIF